MAGNLKVMDKRSLALKDCLIFVSSLQVIGSTFAKSSSKSFRSKLWNWRDFAGSSQSSSRRRFEKTPCVVRLRIHGLVQMSPALALKSTVAATPK